jgi:hypothetical protein
MTGVTLTQGRLALERKAGPRGVGGLSLIPFPTPSSPW